MSYYVDVNFSGRTTDNSGFGQPMSCTIELDTKSTEGRVFSRNVWRVQKPVPASLRDFVGTGASPSMGTWTKEADGFHLFPESDWNNECMELRLDMGAAASGVAFGKMMQGRSGNYYKYEGTWGATDKPLPHTWVGVMGKGSAGLAVGAEGGVAALVEVTTGFHGISFCFGAGRLIIGGGFSGGLALVIATGFKDANGFEGYTSSGADWALSFGPNIKAVAMSGKLARLNPILKKCASGINTVVTKAEEGAREMALKADSMKRIVTNGENAKEIYGVAKGAIQGYLIDTDYQNVTAIDIPLAGAGTEAGFYYAWSRYKTLSRW